MQEHTICIPYPVSPNTHCSKINHNTPYMATAHALVFTYAMCNGVVEAQRDIALSY